jgi:predicted Fe-Mo cluster-binding NifX family protein
MMKIAIVTDDHETISAHFGRALFYEIFTIEAGKVVSRETHARGSQVAGMHGHHEHAGEGHHQHDHNAMIAPIADCQVLVTRGMGMGAHISLKEHGIQPVITDIPEIQPAVEAYLAGTLVDHPERLH